MTPHKKWMLTHIIKLVEKPSQIIETTDENNKAHFAKVLQIGPQVKHTKPGDIIRYTHNLVSGLDLEIEGKNCLFLHEDKHCLFNESNPLTYEAEEDSPILRSRPGIFW